jgi:hypothetical protein
MAAMAPDVLFMDTSVLLNIFLYFSWFLFLQEQIKYIIIIDPGLAHHQE